MTTHTMFDGRLQLYKRGEGRHWQCAARVGGRRFRQTTGEDTLDRAKDVAEEWYLALRGKLRNGEIEPDERTFGSVAKEYLRETKVLAATSRSPSYVQMLEIRMNAHVLPFFGNKPLSAVNRGLVQAYQVHRSEEHIEKTKTDGQPGRPPARSTMLQEIVIVRQVLKYAEGHGWIKFVPSLSLPYLTLGKRGRRAWFSPEEYEQLRKATRRRITEGTRPGWKSHYEDLHNFVVFMVNTGLRPDEALNLEFRDVKVEEDYATRETILVIDVRGKRGVGYCKSMPGAVYQFEEVRKRREAEIRDEMGSLPPDQGKGRKEIDEEIAKRMRTTKLFPQYDRATFNAILEEEGLKSDRDGKPRTAYSLRHTYISMRLMEGANIHAIANNCRTSVQMIEEFYASHIKDRLDASAINVMRPKAARKASKRGRKSTAEDSKVLAEETED